MTNTTATAAHNIAAKVIASLPDADMLAQLMTDDGLKVDGWVVWYRETDGRIIVWAGHDTDPNMDGVVEVPWATYALFDADTADKIGPATAEQISASLAAGDTGVILVDIEGNVIADGSWDARQAGVRKVYVG